MTKLYRGSPGRATLCSLWRVPCSQSNYLLFPQILVGFKRLQAIARSHQLMRQFQTMRQRIVQLQAHCRGYLVRQQFQAKRKAAAATKQVHARGLAARWSFWQQKTIIGGYLVCKGGRAVWGQ